ncbi:MAG: endonuclease V [Pseudomonadota bacterium]
MKIVIDVHYENDAASAAGVLFSAWTDPAPLASVRCAREGLADYEPGQFYKRELPVILDLLQRIEDPLDTIVIDGYVHLGPEARAGLGQHLWSALEQRVAIIGVAKNRFVGTPAESELLRGKSAKPLFVTAVGVDLDEAKRAIAAMHGEHRLPTLLKLVDQLCRQSV